MMVDIEGMDIAVCADKGEDKRQSVKKEEGRAKRGAVDLLREDGVA
jgi:hypothetical protein